MERRTFLSRVLSYLYGQIEGVPANYTREQLFDLQSTVDLLAKMSGELNLSTVREFAGEEDKDTKELGSLFAQYGSDKSIRHDYHRIYAHILGKRRRESLEILEIGLGTNNTDVPSNMGRDGKPGASLRAFRDWAPKAHVYGADVDTRILFNEDRINTYFVDQTKPETFQSLVKLDTQFDLVIDDGLHNPSANFNTINALLDLVKPGGYLIVEDILDKYLSLWQIAISFLHTHTIQL